MEQSLDIKISPISLIKFALPTAIAQIFMGIYSMVDGIFVSNVIGTDALSAVNIVIYASAGTEVYAMAEGGYFIF